MKSLKPYGIDVPVLLIFFARPEPFARVFEQVKLARPSRLFLYQDGPRENHPHDIANIARCRAIAEDIDWDCEVHRLYQTDNVGCDPSEFIAQKWAFSMVDRCIVIEDDDVPSQSFFPFCKELLEKYKDDERINMICGMNNLGIHENGGSSYFFSSSGSIWGWASWRRVIELWEEHHDFLDNPNALSLLKNLEGRKNFQRFVDTCTRHRSSGRAHYESILGAGRRLYSRLNIIPCRNMISNIGIQPDSTHAVSDLRLLPAAIRRLFNMQTYEIEFPLRHPRYVIDDVRYKNELARGLQPRFVWFWRIRRFLLRKIGKLLAK